MQFIACLLGIKIMSKKKEHSSEKTFKGTSNKSFLNFFIGGLQLRHSFFPPKRLDVKTPLKNIGRYLKAMYNSFSGNVLRI